MEVLALDQEPRIGLSEQPAVDEQAASVIKACAEKLESDPYGFNGPQLMAKSFSSKKISAYSARYSYLRAHKEIEDHLSNSQDNPLGPGAMGVCLVLRDSEGRILWQKRSSRVDQPGLWGFSVGGGVTTPNSRLAVITETKEELALQERDLLYLEPFALVRSESLITMYMAQLAPGAKLIIDPLEVTEIRWSESPLEEIENLTAECQRVWQAIRPLYLTRLAKLSPRNSEASQAKFRRLQPLFA